jgi:GH24 family phage-related lysozyme (muramidase)
MTHAHLTEMGARGLVSRWAHVEAQGGPSEVNKIGATGIGQWLGARKQGVRVGDFEGQLAHAAQELNGSERSAGDALRSARTPSEAARGASMYERAEGYDARTGRDNWTSKTEQHIGSISGRGGGGDGSTPGGGRGGGFGAGQRGVTSSTTAGGPAISAQATGTHNQVHGTMVVNGHVYNFVSGGRPGARGAAPYGEYEIGEYQKNALKTYGLPGYTMSNKYDPVIKDTRSGLFIHPGEGASAGCLAIPKSQWGAFVQDMQKDGRHKLVLSPDGKRHDQESSATGQPTASRTGTEPSFEQRVQSAQTGRPARPAEGAQGPFGGAQQQSAPMRESAPPQQQQPDPMREALGDKYDMVKPYLTPENKQKYGQFLNPEAAKKYKDYITPDTLRQYLGEPPGVQQQRNTGSADKPMLQQVAYRSDKPVTTQDIQRDLGRQEQQIQQGLDKRTEQQKQEQPTPEQHPGRWGHGSEAGEAPRREGGGERPTEAPAGSSDFKSGRIRTSSGRYVTTTPGDEYLASRLHMGGLSAGGARKEGYSESDMKLNYGIRSMKPEMRYALTRATEGFEKETGHRLSYASTYRSPIGGSSGLSNPKLSQHGQGYAMDVGGKYYSSLSPTAKEFLAYVDKHPEHGISAKGLHGFTVPYGGGKRGPDAGHVEFSGSRGGKWATWSATEKKQFHEDYQKWMNRKEGEAEPTHPEEHGAPQPTEHPRPGGRPHVVHHGHPHRHPHVTHDGHPRPHRVPHRMPHKHPHATHARPGHGRPGGGEEHPPVFAEGDSTEVRMIKQFERFSPTAYDDISQKSIGYGSKAKEGETSITEPEAAKRLGEEIAPINSWLKENIHVKMSGNQRAGLISFAYNEGVGALDRLKNDINAGNWDKVYKRMATWNKITKGGKKEFSRGIYARRKREIELMATPDGSVPKDFNFKEKGFGSMGLSGAAKVKQLKLPYDTDPAAGERPPHEDRSAQRMLFAHGIQSRYGDVKPGEVEGYARQIAHSRGYKDIHAISGAGTAKEETAAVRQALEENKDITGVLGFSRGGNILRKMLRDPHTPESVKSHIREAFIVGSPETKGKIPGVYMRDIPHMKDVEHMHMLEQLSKKKTLADEDHPDHPKASTEKAPDRHSFNEYYKRNRQTQDSALRHSALDPHHQSAPPPADTANKNPTVRTVQHTATPQPQGKNTNQTSEWTGTHRHPSAAASSRVENAYVKPKSGRDESFSTAGLSNA